MLKIWLITGALHGVVALLMAALGWLLFSWQHPFLRRPEALQPPLGAGYVVSGGFLLGWSAVLAMVFQDREHGFHWIDWLGALLNWGLFGGMGLLFLLLASWVALRVVLGDLAVEQRIVEENHPGAAVTLAGMLIASGLVVAGALSKSLSPRLFLEFFLLGELLLIFFAWVFLQAASQEEHDAWERPGHAAAALDWAGHFIAYALLIAWGLGSSSALIAGAVWKTLFYYTALGALLLPISREAVNRWLTPGPPLNRLTCQHNNLGAGILKGCAAIATALLVIQTF